MPNKTTQGEPTLADILAEIQGLRAEHESFKGEVTEAFGQLSDNQATNTNESDFDVLTRLNGASDADLEGLGLTRAEVDAAVSEYNTGAQAEIDAAAEGDVNADPANTGGQQTQATATAGAAEGTTAQAFKALQKEFVQLKAQLAQKEKIELAAKEEETLDQINGKIDALATQRDQLVEFSERALAEIDALRTCIKTGTRPARGSGSEGGATLKLLSADPITGELTPWQEKIKTIMLQQKVSEADAISLCDKDDNGALHRNHLITLGQRQNGIITT